MARRKPSRPSEGELEILAVLWAKGGRTIAQLQEDLPGPPTVNSIGTRLRIMVSKGLVRRTTRRPFVFHAAISEAKGKRKLLQQLINTVFGGSASNLFAHMLSQRRKASPEELREIRKHLEEFEERSTDDPGGNDR